MVRGRPAWVACVVPEESPTTSMRVLVPPRGPCALLRGDVDRDFACGRDGAGEMDASELALLEVEGVAVIGVDVAGAWFGGEVCNGRLWVNAQSEGPGGDLRGALRQGGDGEDAPATHVDG